MHALFQLGYYYFSSIYCLVLAVAPCLWDKIYPFWPINTRPTVVREVMDSFPVGDSDFFFAPPPPSCDMLNIASFVISSPSLKFTIFLYLSPIGHFDIADPSSMQDACHHELSKYDDMTYARHESPNGSVFRASDRCMPIGTSWVRFPSGTQIFSLSHARDMLNIPSFLISPPSLKFTIFLYLSELFLL